MYVHDLFCESRYRCSRVHVCCRVIFDKGKLIIRERQNIAMYVEWLQIDCLMTSI